MMGEKRPGSPGFGFETRTWDVREAGVITMVGMMQFAILLIQWYER
jgi:hypothetical protein